MKRQRTPRTVVAFIVAIGVGLLASSLPATAEQTAADAPTFNGDVAAILYDNCAGCHRAGQVAPMALTSYRAARPWARAIKAKVVAREMPPWHADPRYGTFRNEMTSTRDEIDTLVAWADAGAPEGTGEAPERPRFSEGWMHPSGRDPDVVIQMPIEYAIPAEGQSPNFTIYQENPFDETVDIQAIQIRPGNLRATHHSSIGARPLPEGTRLGRGPAFAGGPIIDNVPVAIDADETFDNSGDRSEEAEDERRARREREVFAVRGTSLFVFYVPAGGFKQWPAGIGKRIEPEDYLYWGLHYNSTGVPETDRHRAGVWLQEGEMTHEVLSRRVGETHIAENVELAATTPEDGRVGTPRIPVIPPGDPDWAITGITAFRDDVTLYIAWPHMHLRGKDMTFVVTWEGVFVPGRTNAVRSIKLGLFSASAAASFRPRRSFRTKGGYSFGYSPPGPCPAAARNGRRRTAPIGCQGCVSSGSKAILSREPVAAAKRASALVEGVIAPLSRRAT